MRSRRLPGGAPCTLSGGRAAVLTPVSLEAFRESPGAHRCWWSEGWTCQLSSPRRVGPGPFGFFLDQSPRLLRWHRQCGEGLGHRKTPPDTSDVHPTPAGPELS